MEPKPAKSPDILPFDRHQANLTELQEYSAQLIGSSIQGLTNGSATRAAFNPAIDEVKGVCTPYVATADQPLQKNSRDVTGKLAWAAIVSQYWAGQVTAFNAEVDRITSGLANETTTHGASGSSGDADATTQKAKDAWWTAYREHIETGSSKASSMLYEGPSSDNVKAAAEAGAMPGMRWGYSWDEFWSGVEGIFIPPLGDGSRLDNAVWSSKSSMIATSWLTSAYKKTRLMKYVPLPPLSPSGPYLSPLTRAYPKYSFTQWARRNKMRLDPNNRQRKMDGRSSVRWQQATKLGSYADRTFYGLTYLSSGYDQWQTDSKTDMGNVEKYYRASTRASVETGSLYVGIEKGAAWGFRIGKFAGPKGAVVGTIIGGIIGGVSASEYGQRAGDVAVEWTSKVGEALNFWD